MNELAVIVGVILFPGLIATVICDKLTVHMVKWDTFKYSIYSFIFGVFTYLLLQILFYVFAIFDNYTFSVTSIENARLQVWTIVKPNNLSVNLMEVFLASLLAPTIACISAIIVNYKIINKIATKFHISHKYGDENLYSYFLNSKEVDWVYVRDSKNGFTYQGRVVSFSETATFQELIMSDVTVFEYEQSIELYSIPVIYLNKPMGEFVIEVISSDLLEKVNGKKTA